VKKRDLYNIQAINLPLFYYSMQMAGEMICLFPGVVHGGIKLGYGISEAVSWIYDSEIPLCDFSPCHFYNECRNKAASSFGNHFRVSLLVILDFKQYTKSYFNL
jgi:hypothetical protein